MLEFINRNYYHLHFSPEIETTVRETKKNLKRAQRDAKKQILETGIGTKSQQALKLQQEQNELPSPTTSEMVSTIPKQYSKARSQCHYSVGKNPSAYLQMLLDALVAPGTNTLYILRATGS